MFIVLSPGPSLDSWLMEGIDKYYFCLLVCGYIISIFRASRFFWIFYLSTSHVIELCQFIFWVLLMLLFWSAWSLISFSLLKCSCEMRTYLIYATTLESGSWNRARLKDIRVETKKPLGYFCCSFTSIRAFLFLLHFAFFLFLSSFLFWKISVT